MVSNDIFPILCVRAHRVRPRMRSRRVIRHICRKVTLSASQPTRIGQSNARWLVDDAFHRALRAEGLLHFRRAQQDSHLSPRCAQASCAIQASVDDVDGQSFLSLSRATPKVVRAYIFVVRSHTMGYIGGRYLTSSVQQRPIWIAT